VPKTVIPFACRRGDLYTGPATGDVSGDPIPVTGELVLNGSPAFGKIRVARQIRVQHLCGKIEIIRPLIHPEMGARRVAR